jgi:hypothetical protein
MKHPTRHVSLRFRKVQRGQRALSRQVSRIAKRIREDPAFRKMLVELVKHVAEIAARAVVTLAVNRCLRTGLAAREQARVIPIRLKPTAVS